MNSKLLLAPLTLVALAISGCGDTTIVTPERTVEKKTIIKDSPPPPTVTESKEKIVKENKDGSTTKIEKKTETK